MRLGPKLDSRPSRPSIRPLINDISDKLGCLSTIADLIVQFGQRIAVLERENVELRREVDGLRSALSRGRSGRNEIIVSGLPTSSLISPIDLIKNVFSAIEAFDLCCHILNVRAYNIENSKHVGPGSRSKNRSITSYLVSLSSAAVCKAVITKKRIKRILKQDEVCPTGSDLSVFVNEVLSKKTYNLLQSARIVAKEKSYKYVWHRDGQICVRRSDGQPIIFINFKDDLANLN